MALGPSTLIIGAGTVGCALADELTARGWTDVTVVDQGPLFAAGATSPASGLVFQTTGDPVMTRCARATVATYSRLRTERGTPCFRPVGGLEVATTRDRLVDLTRRHGWAAAAGIETRLLDPAECAAVHPLLDRDRVLGGLHIPTDGLAAPAPAARARARAATARGARFLDHHRVTGLDVRGGRIRGVETDRGRFDADVVVSCAGVWGPLLGALVGAAVPLVPTTHQYAWTTPLPELDLVQKLRGLVEPGGAVMPVLRHQDAGLGVREHGDRLGIVAPGHPAVPADPATTGRHGVPAERLFTPGDFEPAWVAAATLLPALGDQKVERGVHGLFSSTPDGMPLLGEHPQVGGFWLAEAVGTAHSAGVAEAVAGWMTDGRPSVDGEPVDMSAADVDRFDAAVLAPARVRAAARSAVGSVDDIVHPHAPAGGARPLRTGPFHARHRELGAVLGEHDGWARPLWFADNADLPEVCEVRPRPAWAGRHWSPIAGAEALVVRRAVALVDRTPCRRAEVTGPDALGLLQQLATVDLDRPAGTVTRALLLDRAGCIRADLSVARLGEQHFTVAAGSRLEIGWLRRHVLGDVDVTDTTAGTCALGLWGRQAGAVLAAAAGADPAGWPDAGPAAIGPVPVTALRGTPAGSRGWELRTTADLGAALWDVLWEAGASHGIIAAGHHAATALLVGAGHRTLGLGVDAALTPAGAGLEHLVDLDKGRFQGRDAVLDAGPPARRLVRLALTGPGEVVLGGEPVFRPGSGGVGDTDAVGRVAAAEVDPDTGTGTALAVVERPRPGESLQVEYLGRRLDAVVSDAAGNV